MKRYFLFPALLFFTFLACIPAKRSAEPMSEGELLFRAKCRSCHRLPEPRKYSDRKWEELVEHYGGRINLTLQEREKIAKYLIENNDPE